LSPLSTRLSLVGWNCRQVHRRACSLRTAASTWYVGSGNWMTGGLHRQNDLIRSLANYARAGGGGGYLVNSAVVLQSMGYIP